jgi:peptidoglycan/xylan/chitin deacetylase (PgdA/CDA1 family)
MKLRRLIQTVIASTSLPESVVRQRTRRSITVLAYHRVAPPPGADYPFDAELFSATPEEFARELHYFRRHLDVISMRELRGGLADPACLPERPAVITFDDGYQDNAEIALPILREVGLPACFFLATRIVDTRQVPWWDQVACCLKHSRVRQVSSPFGPTDAPYDTGPTVRRESIRRFLRRLKGAPWSQAVRCVEQLREVTGVEPTAFAEEPLFMSWGAVRAMSAAGMEIGGHTRTHPIVARLETEEALREEIGGCHDDIAEALGQPPMAFAYPVGSPEAMSPQGDAAICEAGFVLSFSYIHAIAHHRGGASRIPRLKTEYGQNYQAFRLGMARAPRQKKSPQFPRRVG